MRELEREEGGETGLAVIHEKIKRRKITIFFEEYLTSHDYNNTFYAHP